MSVLFDLQQILFDCAADVALGFHVETGGLRAATKPMSISVGPPCAVALSTPLGPPRFPQHATIRPLRGAEPFGRTPPTSPFQQTQKLASYGATWAQGSEGFHVETGVSCIAATPPLRHTDVHQRRAAGRGDACKSARSALVAPPCPDLPSPRALRRSG